MQFTQVVGQSVLKEHFIKEIGNEKFAHAKLLVGTPGYGTLPLALAYVRYLLCANRSNEDSCNQCDSCKKMNILQHPDLHFSYPIVLAESKTKTSKPILSAWRDKIFDDPYFDIGQWTQHIDPKGRKPVIGTDESLEIIKALSLKSYEGGYKIMLIWGVDQMNNEAANKLLKILEEPPPRTLFVLIAASQERMLPTILSRTQLVRVPRIESEDMQAYLQEKYHLPAQDAQSISAQAEGDLITAKSLAMHTQQSNNYEWFVELMRFGFAPDVVGLITWAEKLGSQTKEQQTNFLQYALHLLRQSVLKNYASSDLLRVSVQESEFLSKFARFITGKNIMGFHTLLSQSHYYIERNGNAKLIFTNLSFKVSAHLAVMKKYYRTN